MIAVSSQGSLALGSCALTGDFPLPTHIRNILLKEKLEPPP
jgi:hypothetical protein